MGSDASRPVGSFCWIELATPDRTSAKAFYARLFGWQSQDVPMGPTETYTLFQLAGKAAAGAFDLSHVKQPGVPPHWMLYVAVASADASAARAAELGATVLVQPFDVPAQGRMAVLHDPTGAHFSLWEAGPNVGRQASGTNTLCWADCMTPDPARAAEFYRALFGWKLTAAPKDPSGYLHIQNGEAHIGGIPPAAHRTPGTPPHWLAWFNVADCDAATTAAREAGGKVLAEPTTMERVGRFAVLGDPRGAGFGIITPAF